AICISSSHPSTACPEFRRLPLHAALPIFWRMVPAALATLVIGDLTSVLGIPFIWYWLPLLIGGAAALLAQLAITVHELAAARPRDRKSTRLNHSHVKNPYCVFLLNNKNFG